MIRRTDSHDIMFFCLKLRRESGYIPHLPWKCGDFDQIKHACNTTYMYQHKSIKHASMHVFDWSFPITYCPTCAATKLLKKYHLNIIHFVNEYKMQTNLYFKFQGPESDELIQEIQLWLFWINRPNYFASYYCVDPSLTCD